MIKARVVHKILVVQSNRKHLKCHHRSSVLTETLTVLREESNNFSLKSVCFIREFLFEGKVIGGQENFGLPLVHKESLFSLLNPFQIQCSF